MREIDPDFLMETLAAALETMAFVGVAPLEGGEPCPDPVDVTLNFSGPAAGSGGKIVLRAPSALGALIAGNLEAVDATAPEAVERATDALRELANVTAGLLLRESCPADRMPQLAIPVTQPAAAEPLGPVAASLAADGFPITVAMENRS